MEKGLSFREALAGGILCLGVVLLLFSPLVIVSGEIKLGSSCFVFGAILLTIFVRKAIMEFVRRNINKILIAMAIPFAILYFWEKISGSRVALALAIAIAMAGIAMFLVFKWGITPREISNSIKVRMGR